jgi:hypothetical protein
VEAKDLSAPFFRAQQTARQPFSRRPIEGDPGAPTLINLLHKTAQAVRDNSHIFVRSGARSLTPAEPPDPLKQPPWAETKADHSPGLRAAFHIIQHIELINIIDFLCRFST